MRTSRDRIRHTLLFEIGMLLLCAPLAGLVLDKEITQVGILVITLSLIAMGVNYLYNIIFDLILIKLERPVHIRSKKLRVLHAFLFELTLLFISLPVIATSLQTTYWHAFVTDIGFALFALVYAYIFNLGYDRFFPVLVSKPT
ncbi:MAG: putative membrane protein [Desulforhopalus sp.]|jgi:uncharacterized membrane protein